MTLSPPKSPDNDMAEITISLVPNEIMTGETQLIKIDSDPLRSRVWWQNARRTSAEVASELAVSNAQLHDPEHPEYSKFFMEAIYPHPLDAAGKISGNTTLRVECTLDDDTSTTDALVYQFLDAHNTFYTTVHEQEYSTATMELVQLTNYTTDTLLRKGFVDNVRVQGFGIMVDPIGQYTHLGKNEGGFFLDTTARGSDGQPLTTASAAKLVFWDDTITTPAWKTYKSALDRPSDLSIPLLLEAVDQYWLATKYDDVRTSLTWLRNQIPESRWVHDTGDGEHDGKSIDDPERWMDLYIPYIPPESRACWKNITMYEVLEELPNAWHKVYWTEP